ncbi:YcxB family protein [Peptostreptococcaceae bacterium OttesenSCG-928-C18]|nr:YcxB family protein [Peptostreptococcaceae bacterium OttesenSCG-928-C18]
MEDGILFENEFLLKKEDLKGFFSYTTLRQRVFSLIIGLISIILAVLEYKTENKMMIIILAFLGILTITLFFTLVNLGVNSMEKGGRLEQNVKIQFYKDKLVTTEQGKKSDVYYSDLRKVANNENAFYLMLNRTRGIIVKKKAFTEGTEDEFFKFINKKVVKSPGRRSFGG